MAGSKILDHSGYIKRGHLRMELQFETENRSGNGTKVEIKTKNKLVSMEPEFYS